MSGELLIGNFTAFNLYVAMLVWPLRTLGQRTGQSSVPSRRQYGSTRCSKQPAVVEPGSPRHLAEGAADVSCEHVRFGYDPARPVLDGLDLAIPAGTSIALVGSTGSGKSSAAALLARMYDVQEGAVRVGGVDVRDLVAGTSCDTRSRSCRKRRSCSATRCSRTSPSRDRTRPARTSSTPRAWPGRTTSSSSLPEGYDTVLGERGFSLSGGQRQRLALARAILADPRVLVLDDATSSVDATKEHEIRAALATVMHGRTTLVIAHRPATVALADRVAVLDGGRIVESGNARGARGEVGPAAGSCWRSTGRPAA